MGAWKILKVQSLWVFFSLPCPCPVLGHGPGPGPVPSPGPSPGPWPKLVPVLGPSPGPVLFLVPVLVPSYLWSQPWSRSHHISVPRPGQSFWSRHTVRLNQSIFNIWSSKNSTIIIKKCHTNSTILKVFIRKSTLNIWSCIVVRVSGWHSGEPGSIPGRSSAKVELRSLIVRWMHLQGVAFSESFISPEPLKLLTHSSKQVKHYDQSSVHHTDNT